VGAVITAAIFLLIPDKTQKVLIPYLISYATGTLLASALLGLISFALIQISSFLVLSTVLTGLILFFLLEKLLFGFTATM
jgi:zinc and cadmium transporter